MSGVEAEKLGLCPCGSGKKYKKCCLGGDRLNARKFPKANPAAWRFSGRKKRSEKAMSAIETMAAKDAIRAVNVMRTEDTMAAKGVDEGARLSNPDISGGASGNLSGAGNNIALHDAADREVRDMKRDDLLNLRYDSSVITRRMKRIHHQLLEGSEYLDQGNFTCIAPVDLRRLFELYDENFFGHFFRNNFQGKIHFNLSKRMTRVGGKIVTYRIRDGTGTGGGTENGDGHETENGDENETGNGDGNETVTGIVNETGTENRTGIGDGNENGNEHGGRRGQNENPLMHVIILSSTLLFQTFQGEDRQVVVNGIMCRDRLEAAMRIFEHEIIHLVERVLFAESSCSKPRFRSLSNRIFGHTDVTHQLVTGKEIAKRKFGLKPGDMVSFEFEGNVHRGFISRITKRATVMVKNPEGNYKDNDGNRYRKYYIPLQFLKLSK